jgi:hypothetical protein
LLTLAQVAAEFGVDRAYVEGLIQHGALPATMGADLRGRRWLVQWHLLAAWIAEHHQVTWQWM